MKPGGGNPVAYAQGLYEARQRGIPSLTLRACMKPDSPADRRRPPGLPSVTMVAAWPGSPDTQPHASLPDRSFRRVALRARGLWPIEPP
jgi:hypothetical protein